MTAAPWRFDSVSPIWHSQSALADTAAVVAVAVAAVAVAVAAAMAAAVAAAVAAAAAAITVAVAAVAAVAAITVAVAAAVAAVAAAAAAAITAAAVASGGGGDHGGGGGGGGMAAAMPAAITADQGPAAVRAVAAMRRVPATTVADTERWDTVVQPAMMGRPGMLVVRLAHAGPGGTLVRAGMLVRAAVTPMRRASATG